MRYSRVLRDRLASIERDRAARARGELPASLLRTGLKSFDARAGIERSILTVIGAPPGEGKSIFRKHLAEFSAQSGLAVLDISFEDPRERDADRTLAKSTGINSARLLAASIDDRELEQVRAAVRDAVEWSERIDYHDGLKTPDECLKLITDSNADLVQVDYAQAFPEGDRGLERTIADFAWELNKDAQKRGRATIVYSQLTREVELRGVRVAEASKRRGGDHVDISGFRPFGVADLAWSTALGQRAKGLGFLFRPGRYRKRFGEQAADDRMELIWPKKNFGAEGLVTVGFDGKTARLFDVDKKGERSGNDSTS